MILDSGAPLSIVGSNWFENYIKVARVKSEDISYKDSARRFRLGETLYTSKKEVKFPIVMKIEENDYIRREVKANVIDFDGISILCGLNTMTDWDTSIRFRRRELEFVEQGKNTPLTISVGGHMIVDLERVGDWSEEESILLVKKENDVTNKTAITRIHKNLNHKKIKQMNYAFENAGKLTNETKKMIKEVVENCMICKKNERSKSKPAVAISRTTDFNSVIAIDLKEIDDKYILWMICSFTRFIKGFVVRSKLPEKIIKGIHEGWCMNFGFPTVGFWSDNGGEFRNVKMEEFTNKLGIKINFGPSYSPWSNGINERNHYSCDVIVRKVMEEDKTISLEDAVNMAAWTHNTNVNTLGFTPLQLVTGKNIIFPGISAGNISTESLYDDEAVRKIMERHSFMTRAFREMEFNRKLEIACNVRSRGYEDEILNEGDWVFYQPQGKKSWLGPVKIHSIYDNSIFLFANGSLKKIPRCNVKLHEKKGVILEEPKEEIEIEKEKSSVHFDDFGEDIKEDDIKKVEGMKTRLQRKKELEKDALSTFWMVTERNECYDDLAIYAVEVPIKEHKLAEVVEAKEKEIQNLFKYEVFEEVEDIGQTRIGSRWVITRKEKEDGQKTICKGRLVARGFQEDNNPQSDSPTMLRESLKLFFVVAANENFKLRSIDIKAAFLQAKGLDREVFLEPPKDVKTEGKLWLLKKPLYGLNDASRKFWLKVRQVFDEIGLKRLDGDEAFYYRHDKDGQLEGMISSHVDDFNIAGNDDFIKTVTEKIKNDLDISKIEDDEFRFTGIDVKQKNGRIEISMEDYAKSLKPIEVREGKSDEKLTREEMKVLRKYVGKLNWLATNTRPDLSIYALGLAKKQKDATLKELRNINRIIKKVSEKDNVVVFTKVAEKKDLCMLGVSDASYNQEGHSVAGEIIILGCKSSLVCSPVYWKSGIIRKICTSPKAAETRGIMKLLDDGCNMTKQMSILMNMKIPLKLFTDSRPLLESIGSTNQIAEKALRQSIAFIKQSLEDEEVINLSWIEGTQIVADVFTKEGSKREVLNEIIKEGMFRHAQHQDNLVVFEDNEIKIRNLTTKKINK